MGCANFRSMDNFYLVAMDFYHDDVKCCRECGTILYDGVEQCYVCESTDLEDCCDFYDEVGEYNFRHDLQKEIDALNYELMFHTAEIKSGYFSGLQIYVEDYMNPEYLDNEGCHINFDLCRSKAIRKYESEINKINRFLLRCAYEFGMELLNTLCVASNGETIYKSKKVKKHGSKYVVA